MSRTLAASLLAVAAASGCSRQEAPSAGSPPARAPAAETVPAPSEAGGGHTIAPAPAQPDEVQRVSVTEARQLVQAGDALLVCAYDSEERCSEVALEGSTSWPAFSERASSLPRDTRLIFYCS